MTDYRPVTNETHDPNLKSWVESANDPATDFPIQNLPLCRFMASHDGHTHEHVGCAIGDQILDISMLAEAGMFADPVEEGEATLGELILYEGMTALLVAPEDIELLREELVEFLKAGPATGGQQSRRLRQKALRSIKDTELLAPAVITNYSDFYASIHHATNVGTMFRPDNALLPNYKHVPIGYHGRASSIVPSGASIIRPKGQLPPLDAEPGAGPSFGPCKMLDYELEVGAVIGGLQEMGETYSADEAPARIAGLCLVNDWSARDIQKWEYQPLGPFLAKSFATSVSPFLVTYAALEPFRCPAFTRPAGDPRPLPYLMSEEDQHLGGFDITLEVYLETDQMRKRNLPPHRLSRTAFRDMYWTFAQMVAHHTSNGCNLIPGDLLASGTVSGPNPDNRGCLLELTWQGNGPDGKPRPRKPIELPGGETRTFLADGDTVILKGFCERDGFRRIGFGECRGTIAPARA